MAASTLDPIVTSLQANQIDQLRLILQQEGSAHLTGSRGEPAVEVPATVRDLLSQILQFMQQGQAISIVPSTRELTTQQAAEVMGVSRPFLVKLIESGKVSSHRAGTHRRIYLKDLLAYKQKRDEDRHSALNRLTREADRCGLYDKVLLPNQRQPAVRL